MLVVVQQSIRLMETIQVQKIHLDNLKPLTYHPFYHDSFYQNFPYNQSPQFKYKHILSIHLSDMEYNYNIVSFDTKILMINHLMLVLMHI